MIVEIRNPLNLEMGTFEIFDLLGRKIRKFNIPEIRITHSTITWDGKDNFGRQVPQGVYFGRLTKTRGGSSVKLLFLK